MIPPADVKELLDYNEQTGIFTWLKRSEKHFKLSRDCIAWNGRFSGKEAGGLDGRGYGTISIHYQTYKSHRLAWCYVKGEWPNGEIDHINGKILDNRINNLRVVDRFGNNRNLKLNVRNKTGKMGVRFDSRRNKWYAKIGSIYIGSFNLKSEAITARETAEIEIGYHKNHGRE